MILDDVRFVLHDVLGEAETYDDVLAGAAELCRDVVAPLNAPGDLAGAVWNDGNVTTPVQAAARGRFAERFRSNADPLILAAREGRHHGWAHRHAWKRGLRAAFVPWLGPVFWPYAYSDIFNYTFWPYAYDRGYWAYAYDDFVDTVFWGAEVLLRQSRPD